MLVKVQQFISLTKCKLMHGLKVLETTSYTKHKSSDKTYHMTCIPLINFRIL